MLSESKYVREIPFRKSSHHLLSYLPDINKWLERLPDATPKGAVKSGMEGNSWPVSVPLEMEIIRGFDLTVPGKPGTVVLLQEN
jgi:hypothetical protein